MSDNQSESPVCDVLLTIPTLAPETPVAASAADTVPSEIQQAPLNSLVHRARTLVSTHCVPICSHIGGYSRDVATDVWKTFVAMCLAPTWSARLTSAALGLTGISMLGLLIGMQEPAPEPLAPVMTVEAWSESRHPQAPAATSRAEDLFTVDEKGSMSPSLASWSPGSEAAEPRVRSLPAQGAHIERVTSIDDGEFVQTAHFEEVGTAHRTRVQQTSNQER